MKRVLVLVLSVFVLATSFAFAESDRRSKSLRGAGPITHQGIELRYRITASKPRLNRRLMGPVRRWVLEDPDQWNTIAHLPTRDLRNAA